MGKLAVVDVARVLDESETGRAGAMRLKAAWQVKRDEFDALQKKLGAAALAPDSPGAQQLQQADAEAQGKLGEMRRKLGDDVLQEVRPVLAALCKEKGVDLVCHQASVVLLVDPALDLTTELIARLDAATRGRTA